MRGAAPDRSTRRRVVPPRGARRRRWVLRSTSARPPVGASPVSSANAVAPKLNTSAARVETTPPAISGARKPGVPPRAASDMGTEDEPRSTTTTRPVPSMIRLAGLTSPCTTPCPCRNVSTSAAWADHRNTLETGSPGRPASASTRGEVHSVDPVEHEDVAASVEQVVARVREPRVRWQRQQRAALRRTTPPVFSPGGTGRIFSATRRSWRVSTALTTVASPPRPRTSIGSYRSAIRWSSIGGSEIGERDDPGVERGVGQPRPPPLGAVDAELLGEVRKMLLDRVLRDGRERSPSREPWPVP